MSQRKWSVQDRFDGEFGNTFFLLKEKNHTTAEILEEADQRNRSLIRARCIEQRVPRKVVFCGLHGIEAGEKASR